MIRQLLNTLYVQSQGAYLRLDHETVVVESEGQRLAQVPLHHLGGVSLFGNVMLSPFLLARCADDGRAVTWFSSQGRFQARLVGPTTGNVLLRRAQHEALSNKEDALAMAKAFVIGKMRNSRHILQRALRDGHEGKGVEETVAALDMLAAEVPGSRDLDALRGLEGTASAAYFAAFPLLLKRDGFTFSERSRRPPRDPVNALLSFSYALLASECVAALEGVGLDPQVGYLHALRPGRPALALDLMEEFRSVVADRAVLTLINRGQIQPGHFEHRPGGAVLLSAEGRRLFLAHWQERKQEEVKHAVTEEQVPLGLVPHVQARLLARTLRGDVPEYPSYHPK